MNTFTFKDKTQNWTISVKQEFLKVCSNPENYTAFELNDKFFLIKYLHNEVGPAVIRHNNNQHDYWIDGICVTTVDPEKAKKIQAVYEFNEKLNKALSE